MESKEMRLSALRDEVRKLAGLRQSYQAESTKFDAIKQEFADRHADQMSQLDELKAKVAEQEVLTKALAEAIRDFHPDEKEPAPGVKYRKVTDVEFEEEDALEWAVEENHLSMLKLNNGKFKAAAKALDLDFVVVDDHHVASIAKNLDELYPANEVVDPVQEIALPHTQPAERTESAEEDPWDQ